MKRPRISSYIFGNSIVGLLAYAAFAFVGYKAYTGEASAIAVLIAFWIAGYCSTCSKRVQDYRLWQLEWDAMSGAPPKLTLFQRAPWLGHLVNAAMWGAILYGILIVTPEAYQPLLKLVYGIAAVIVLIVMWFKHRTGRSKKTKRPQKETSVSVCLPVPTQSADLGQTYAVLPSHCQQILSK